ncbi:MAG: hypothetical protein IPM53_01780 [Anaerolineaceae bacterium]|nr:hypothetical protein [Anaerolineaceae bacterium]
MTTLVNLPRFLGRRRDKANAATLTVQPYHPTDMTVVGGERPLPVQQKPEPIIIHLPPHETQTQTETLSNFLRVGRQYHPICRGKFVDKTVIGFYYYERRIEYRTCALAAAYVGAFGPSSVEDSDFSKSMALWKLKRKLGFDLEALKVTGPTGRNSSLAQELISLTDIDGWNRRGIAEWLETIGL